MRIAPIPGWLSPWLLRAAHLNARLLHPLTIGVRAAVLDDGGRVFLVKHSYLPGWHLPGGGVEPGETIRQGMIRELREEAAIEPDGPMRLHGVFFNPAVGRRDHVAVFVVRRFRVLGPRRPDWEIIDSGFFPLADLPADTARPSRARLAEILDGTEPPEDW